MVNTSAYPMTVDGVRLDTLAHNIEVFSGRLGMPAVRGENRVLPGRHGRKWRAKQFDEASKVLSMWVNGCDADGAIPGGSNAYREFRKNLDALNTLFGTRHRLLDIKQMQLGETATERQILAEVQQVIDPEVFGFIAAKFSVELRVPAAFWQDTADITYTSAANLASGVILSLAGFAGATAPMGDLIYLVKGPANAPKLIDYATAHYVQLATNLADGTNWRINAGTWESSTGVGLTLTSGTATSVVGSTVASGIHLPEYMVLTPNGVVAPQLQLVTGGGNGANTQVQVMGRRKYLS